MMSNNSDYVNNLLNQLAYVDLAENYVPGDNLIDTLRNSGDRDLADALEAAGYGNYVIRDYENCNDSNGFAAIAIEDPATGDVGISFRGTENIPNMGNAIQSAITGDGQAVRDAINNQIDMIDNASTAVTGDSAQAQEALDFYRRNRSDTGSNYLYGHSKGGELAMEVYVENHKDIDGVHIINPQPINWASLDTDQLLALTNGKVDATVIDGDLVWMLGGVPYPVRVIQNNGSDGSFFGPHSLSSASYDPETGAAIPEYNPYSNYNGQGMLGVGLMLLITNVQTGYQGTQNVWNWIQEAQRYFSDEFPEDAMRFWESINDAWEETKDVIRDTADGIRDYFTDMTDNFRKWWSEIIPAPNPDSDNRPGRRTPASYEPCQFRVDTRRLQQASAQLRSVSRQLDQLESTLSGYARSFHRLSFTGTVALKASLAAASVKTGSLCGNASDLANALAEIADLYDKTESQIRNNAHI